MSKGKPLFEEPDDTGEEPSGDFEAAPDATDYLIVPTPARPQLTPRDLDHNRGVSRLFGRVMPGLPIDADPPEIRREAEPFSALIEKALKRLKIDASPWLDELAQAWPSLVPPDVAKAARPGKWEDGILYVYVASSTRLFEIRRQYLKHIEEAVRAFAGDGRVRQVRLLVNAVPLPYHHAT